MRDIDLFLFCKNLKICCFGDDDYLASLLTYANIGSKISTKHITIICINIQAFYLQIWVVIGWVGEKIMSAYEVHIFLVRKRP